MRGIAIMIQEAGVGEQKILEGMVGLRLRSQMRDPGEGPA